MATKGPGLADVLDIAFKGWQPLGASYGFRERIDGGASPDWRSPWPLEPGPGDPTVLLDPLVRIFRTETGQRVNEALGGDERKTLAALDRLTLEATAEALRLTGKAGETDRFVVMPRNAKQPPTLMLMSPKLQSVGQSRIISDELHIALWAIEKGMSNAVDPQDGTPEAIALGEVLKGRWQALFEVFAISQPEIVLTRRPRMIPLCVPSPHVKITAEDTRTTAEQGSVSTAGVLCRDQHGEFGVTGCFHGTGPVGTKVWVGGQSSAVKNACPVQDLVFIPLPESRLPSSLAGLKGVRQDREPAKADRVHFDGATNQNCETRIFGTDNGLLRARPNMQLKIQTDPDTDEGDSGCALLDENDQVLGFAFERTAYDDYPRLTDWIWASNGLRALDLTPCAAGAEESVSLIRTP
ncbi:hypothetical protein [Bradyrhizobium sp.]|uniref:hypothetical protein n=1 Tax=Bradyrhizobium sp. TaxID=376 RepID=UPI003C631FD9